MNRYSLNYKNAIKYISLIDRIKLLFNKPMYLCSKEFNFKIKYKVHKGKLYILKEMWENKFDER